MTDATGSTPMNGAASANASGDRQGRPNAGPKAGDARVSPVIPSLSDSLTSELAAEGEDRVAKPKSTARKTTPSASRRTASARATAGKTAAAATGRKAAAPEPGLSEDDSVLIAGIDEARARAVQFKDWASVRRQEARDAVRTHPLGSSVMVFAAGMIFGLLMARR